LFPIAIEESPLVPLEKGETRDASRGIFSESYFNMDNEKVKLDKSSET